jgi:hypothetical protein
MVAALLILVIFLFVVWLLLFWLKLLKFSPAPGIVSAGLLGVHVLLIILIGIRFVTSYSMDARAIQYAIQPELPICTSGLRIVHFSCLGYNERHLSRPERGT